MNKNPPCDPREWLATVTDRGKSRPHFFELFNFLFELRLRRIYDMDFNRPYVRRTIHHDHKYFITTVAGKAREVTIAT
jgi:hypothetical protein